MRLCSSLPASKVCDKGAGVLCALNVGLVIPYGGLWGFQYLLCAQERTWECMPQEGAEAMQALCAAFFTALAPPDVELSAAHVLLSLSGGHKHG